jgi:DNA-binding CsgD family transcriptional regulator
MIPELLGREDESAALDAVLESARSGTGQSLVLTGDAGIGKSALLKHAARSAGDMDVLWLRGSAVRDVLGPLLNLRPVLPAPQQAALSEDEPACFMAGLAALGLFATVSRSRPLLCLADDADQLNPTAQAVLAVAARRLTPWPVAMLFAARSAENPFDDLPNIPVAGLSAPTACRLLGQLAGDKLDPWTRDRLAIASSGSPLALAELATRYTAAELGWIAISPLPVPIGEPMLTYYGMRADGLPADTRALLLALAAAPDQDVAAVGSSLGFGVDSWQAAARAGLLTGCPPPRFTHPLIRSAVYYGAPLTRRQRVHAILAASGAPGQRAWHRAQAAPGPDENLARELADAAEQSLGYPERCLLYVRATELSADPAARAARYAAGAEAALIAGASVYAGTLADRAEAGFQHSPAARARAAGISDQASRELGQPTRRPAAAWLLEAARAELVTEPALSRDTTLSALSRVLLIRDGTCGITPAALAEQIREVTSAKPAPGDLGALLLAGFGRLIAGDYLAAVDPLRRALSTATDPAALTRGVPDWFPLVAIAAVVLWDDTAGTDWLRRVAEQARAQAAVLHERHALGLLQRLEAGGYGLSQTAPVVLALGESRFADALRAANDIRARDSLNLDQDVLTYLIESAAACGRPDQAQLALLILREKATAAGTDWALGQLRCAEGMLAGPDAADKAFTAAIEHLRRTRIATDLARVYLLHGEYLLRWGRSTDASSQLRTAASLFADLGAPAFASRARRGLRASGERLGRRPPAADASLTSQEAQIARLAASGATNRDIAGQLVVSASTVDYHLRKVFRKLGVSSRRALRDAIRWALRRRPPSADRQLAPCWPS